MRKKVALVLIMVLFVNMIAWADSSTADADTEATFTVLVIIGIAVVIGLLSWGIGAMMAEADAPDDGVRLASMQTVPVPKTPFGSFVKVLQHVELGQSQDKDIYVGLRFQF